MTLDIAAILWGAAFSLVGYYLACAVGGAWVGIACARQGTYDLGEKPALMIGLKSGFLMGMLVLTAYQWFMG
jgi:hypothetical protein